MPWKEDYKGTGSMEEFISDCVLLFTSLNNVNVIMPPNYSGNPVELVFEEGETKLNMADALIFSLDNVVWNFTGDADIDSYSAEVVGGQLQINVEANTP